MGMLWDEFKEPSIENGQKSLVKKTINGSFYHVRGTFRDSKISKVEVWKRPNATRSDRLRTRVFNKGANSPRFQLRPGYRDYPHWVFGGNSVKLNKSSTFYGMKGGLVHGIERKRAPLSVIRDALKSRGNGKYFRRP
jgi:hypothetical protein